QFFVSSSRRHTRFSRDWSSDVCSSDLVIESAPTPGVVLLENLRFNAGEASKDAAEREAFAAQLAALGDVVVSDGFGVVHRKQARSEERRVGEVGRRRGQAMAIGRNVER